MIESIRFHKVGDEKVDEIEGFPKKVNIYIELIDFFWGGGRVGPPTILKNRHWCVSGFNADHLLSCFADQLNS